jgi:hypothetical protein
VTPRRLALLGVLILVAYAALTLALIGGLR